MVSHERGEMLSLTKTDTTTNRHKALPNYNCPRECRQCAILPYLRLFRWYDYRKWLDGNILERINTISIIFASAIDKQFIRVFQSRCGYHGAVDHELLPAWRLLSVQKD
jgi:hypothetical protein